MVYHLERDKMKYIVVLCIGMTLGALVQYRADSAFVATAFDSSTRNFTENVEQGAALLNMCEAQLKGAK